ncbi:MAG: hypothetical protein WC510_05355 [Candidatus Omnitrophota bacterium]
MKRIMDRAYNLKFIIVSMLGILLPVTGSLLSAEDIFSLSYSLTEGGYELVIDAANLNKGVKIDITSNVATRYELVQDIVQPLRSRDNPDLAIRNNFVVRGLRGTNKYGDLRLTSDDTPVRSSELVYVSSPAGDADNFTLVYGIRDIENIPVGDYYGRISYTLNPIGSARAIVTKFLDVHVRVAREKEATPLIEIITSDGSPAIRLNSQREEAQSSDVQVKINGNFSNLFSITQTLSQELESEEGLRLEPGGVNFAVQPVRKGNAVTQASPVSIIPQIVYTSTSLGGADNSLVITYSLGDLSKQRAGRYSANMQYFLEEAGKPRNLIGSLRMEIENSRVFNLLITPEDASGVISFRNLKPTDEPKRNEVIIEVKSNLGKRYEVIQKVSSDLTNKEGDVMPEGYFRMVTEGLDTRGFLKVAQKDAVKKGDTVLFISDAKGSSDKFKAVYELTTSADIKGGDYSTSITYSLLEL